MAPDDPGDEKRLTQEELDRIAGRMRLMFGELEFHGAQLDRASKLMAHMLRALAEGRVPPDLTVIDGGAGTVRDEGES